MAVVEYVLSNIVVLLAVYFIYKSYKNEGIAKDIIDKFLKWIETGDLK